uniref:Uncharacterized protein n=1 Tax=Ralstonia syzygii R24 TaxID=907261 RepID=G3AAX4_9RALS|nr:hypothetical protein RALSY_mp30482 [Ralstonia syzygii R24]
MRSWAHCYLSLRSFDEFNLSQIFA